MNTVKKRVDVQLSSEVHLLEKITGPTELFLEESSFSPKSIIQILIAIEEIFTNICKYAYPNLPGNVWYSLNEVRAETGTLIEIQFMDEGPPYNPILTPCPDITADITTRNEGGLGLHLIKGFDIALSYYYSDNKNILFMRKEK